MGLLRVVGVFVRIQVLGMITILFLIPASSSAEDFKIFTSDEYGFTMKYPSSWVKIDRPQGNYYVVFQAPELVDNFRSRIHVAAHSPVKDSLEVFKQELRSGISELQGKSGAAKEKQTVQILEEGDFKCEVPGAYYFFIQAYEDKIKIWMDIIIVFFKNDQTLLRISCLAPSQSMEKFHQTFNSVLVSVNFLPGPASQGQPAQQPPVRVPPPPSATQPQAQPTMPPAGVAPPPKQAVEPPVGQSQPQVTAPPQSMRPQAQPAPAPSTTETQPVAPAGPAVQPSPAPKPGPRGPSRAPEGPATGIVN
jgi:hypothetical protein